MIDQSRAYQYAKWCTQRGNRKVGKYVKLQARKWLRIADGRHKNAYVSEKAYRKICKLLKLMIHPDLHCSMYDGLEDYAWFLIAAVFCTRRREDDRRFYQTAILEIARKNFKTFNSAVIFILGMLTEPRFSRFFSVAPDFKLSSELRLAVRKIIKVSPALTKYFKINRDMITCLINEIEYTPLAYSNDGMDGRLANIFLADEAGALDSYPVEAMRSSQITLVNKLGIIISTQYPNDNNVMIDEVDIAKKVLDGVLEKENVFALLYEPDDALRKRWETDDLVIYQANPVAVNNKEVFDSIKDLRTMAILYENKRENFLCKHCNIMYKGLGVEGYIDVQKVRRCRVAEDLDFWRGRRVWVGLDLSQSDDNTSVAMVTEADGMIHAKVWGILPKDRVEIKTKKENVDYRKLIAAGSCFAEGEEVIDYGFVERWILGLEEKYGVEVMQVGYDRYNAISTVQKLEANSMECVEVKQHSSVLHPPTKLLREAILKKEFAYDENRLLEINFQNARCKQAPHLAPPVPVVGHITAPQFQMGGQALGLQHIGQCLGVGLGVILVGTLTGAEDEAVFLGLGQCQLVGDAVLLQVQQGRTAQHQIVVLDTPEAAQVVDAAHAHSTGKQGGAAQTAVHGLIGAQIHTGAPDLGALLGLVQGQDAGSQLACQVIEILFLHLGPAAGSGIPGQQALAVNAVGTKKLYLARVEQAGHGFGHPVVLPIVKAAAPGRQCQHRHAAVAVALKLHGAVQHRAPFLIINTIHTQTQ